MSAKTSRLLTAPEVARHCSADLKTIHNWVNAGQIRTFRTPGRHLRFQPEDVVEFLEKYGYPVPTELRHLARPVAIVIEPDFEMRRRLERYLARRWDVRAYECPIEALISIGRDQPDLVVLEVELDALDGLLVVERLLSAPTNGASPPKIIVFSNADSAARSQELGVHAVVPKDAFPTLRRKVSQLLGNRARGDEPRR